MSQYTTDGDVFLLRKLKSIKTLYVFCNIRLARTKFNEETLLPRQQRQKRKTNSDDSSRTASPTCRPNLGSELKRVRKIHPTTHSVSPQPISNAGHPPIVQRANTWRRQGRAEISDSKALRASVPTLSFTRTRIMAALSSSDDPGCAVGSTSSLRPATASGFGSGSPRVDAHIPHCARRAACSVSSAAMHRKL